MTRYVPGTSQLRYDGSEGVPQDMLKMAVTGAVWPTSFSRLCPDQHFYVHVDANKDKQQIVDFYVTTVTSR